MDMTKSYKLVKLTQHVSIVGVNHTDDLQTQMFEIKSCNTKPTCLEINSDVKKLTRRAWQDQD